MTLHVVADIWNLVRDALPEDDVQQLADEMVGILVDNDYDLDDIRHEFTGDGEVQNAVSYYADTVDEDGSDDDWDDGEDLLESDEDDWGDSPDHY